MKTLTVLLISITDLLTAAHFLRNSNMLIMTIFIMLPFILFIKSKLAFLLTELSLIFSLVEWFVTIKNVVIYRMEFGTPFIIFTVIMSVVVLFNLLSQVMLIIYRKKFIIEFF